MWKSGFLLRAATEIYPQAYVEKKILFNRHCEENFRFDLLGDGGFHIVAGEAQIAVGTAENAFNCAQCAFLGDGTAGDIQACYQHAFFTGKTHR